MRAVVVAAGEGVDERVRHYLKGADLVIAADAGAAALLNLGLVPQAAVGDFDSLGETELGRLRRLGCPLIVAKAEKDETDTELAVRYALAQGASSVLLLGAIGSRLDHTWANLVLLARLAQEGFEARAAAPPVTVYAVSSELTLSGRPGDIVSVFPVLGGAIGVTEKGFKYPLTDRTLEASAILGVSNELLGNEGRISVKRGVLLVFHYSF
ncbi:MAG: thiamine pyrophosphokinae [Bacillota bacterium]|jgi:thiamine pyrophosphokinase|nr:thiamine pyrophosphokinae [Bacillota bacterium]MDK2882018.1 thiamine pyrophosphokinae [Bacillota bacterium]MDK2960043.1 thiamine pyrophosphokinae [Bacillota bacterium]